MIWPQLLELTSLEFSKAELKDLRSLLPANLL